MDLVCRNSIYLRKKGRVVKNFLQPLMTSVMNGDSLHISHKIEKMRLNSDFFLKITFSIFRFGSSIKSPYFFKFSVIVKKKKTKKVTVFFLFN